MNKNLLFAAFTMACLLVTSCKNDNQGIPMQNVQVSFNGSISSMTRIQGTAWEANDNIGIFMLRNEGTTIADQAENYEYVTAAGDGIFSAANAEKTIYYPLNKSKVDFIAYSPYNENISNASYTIGNWNSTRQDTLDLLYAKATGYSQTNPEVSLSFYHQFSKLILNITANNETGLTNDDLAGMTVAIEGINKPATFNLLTKTATYAESLAVAVSMQVAANGLSAEAIIPSSKGTNIVFTLANGNSYTWDISSLNFASGKCYAYSVSLKAAPNYVEANLGAIINDWSQVPQEEVNLDENE